MFARGLLMTAVMASALLPLAACSTKDSGADSVQVSDGGMAAVDGCDAGCLAAVDGRDAGCLAAVGEMAAGVRRQPGGRRAGVAAAERCGATVAGAAHAAFLEEQHRDHAEEGEQRRNVRNVQRDEKSRRSGADVRTEDDAGSAGELHQPRVDKADGHGGGRV